LDSLTVGTRNVAPGERARIEIPLAEVPATQLVMPMPIEVVNGTRTGPAIWISAVVHGDELNGVEIVRQVLGKIDVTDLRGTVIAVPIVNMFGFVLGSRYLPDRRDLNRSFPGSLKGSLAARLAHTFMSEVVAHCSHGIDLHTGSDHRRNLPQIRADLQDPEARQCALAFAAPVTIDAHTRDGSMRDAATRRGKHVLMYEGGEPQRFNRDAVSMGVRGVLSVLSHLDMIDADPNQRRETVIAVGSQWLRARSSGLARLKVDLGEQVEKGQRLAYISDAFGADSRPIVAPKAGIIIGRAGNPVVRRGDALIHLATEFEPATDQTEHGAGSSP
jgi:predicted deacylase